MRLIGAGLVAVGLAVPAAAQSPMTFELHGSGGNCYTCEWIQAEGTITADTPGVLQAYLDETGSRAQIVFNSPGGDLGAGLALGRVIRAAEMRTALGSTALDAYGAKTLTPGTCESACAFAFMGGVSRMVHDRPDAFVPRGGRIGMHQFFSREGQEIPSAATQQIMGQLLLYVLDMGIDPQVLALASATPGDGMYHFSDEEAVRYRLHTEGGVTGTRFVELGDGVAVAWDMVSAAGEVERRAALFCSTAARGWILQVIEAGATSVETGFDRAAPEAMRIRVGERTFPVKGRQILGLQLVESGLALTVRLRLDLTRHAGEAFDFRTTDVRVWGPHLSAQGTVPDVRTLSVMQRACVS